MYTIDRSSSVSPSEQLADHLRFEIGSGKYRPGSLLPSTRQLGKQISVSFHTVARAYKRLVEDGLLESLPGRGFRVLEARVAPMSDRMERGAEIVQEALKRLTALGLNEQDIDYVIQEQLEFFDSAPAARKILFVGPSRELSEAVAARLEVVLQEPVIPVTRESLSRHPDADLVFAPIRNLIALSGETDDIPVRGLLVHFEPEVLESIARMLPHETLGVVTRYPDSIAPILAEIKSSTALRSQVVATALDAPRTSVQALVRQVDLLAYTPDCRRQVKHLAGHVKQFELLWTVSPLSLATLRGSPER